MVIFNQFVKKKPQHQAKPQHQPQALAPAPLQGGVDRNTIKGGLVGIFLTDFFKILSSSDLGDREMGNGKWGMGNGE